MMAIVYYLLKVLVCSGCLFLYYHLALKNKVFHQWNRFYLLATVALSLLLPILQITIWHSSEEDTKAIQLIQVVQSADNYLEEFTVTNNKGISPEKWMMAGYLSICFGLLITLLVSLLKILAIIRKHTSQWLHNICFITTNEPGTPFSFFHFIFWNQDISLQTETGQQIFQHELVHVQEKHTLDKLFMQTVLILFWCNPFFWLIRRELKFIHEFIADKKAVGEQGTPAFAAMILQTAYPQHFNSIANPFFQTAIKRRIQMLTKIQSPRRAYLSRVIALPLIAVIAFAFTVRTKTANVPVIPLQKEIVVVIDAGHGKMANGSYNGARSGEVYEDDIVLALAKEIQEINLNDKIKIVLTRSDENIIGLKERVAVAEKVKADLFISLHVNAHVPERKDLPDNGIEIYVSTKNPAQEDNSVVLGSAIASQLSTVYKTDTDVLKRNVGAYVLNNAPCPAILVECGYVTNDGDRAFITKTENQKIIAQKILSGIELYAATVQGINRPSNLVDTLPKKNTTPTESVLDLLQKSKKEISSLDVKTRKEININYTDGTSEVLTEQEAQKRGLINNGGFGNEKLSANSSRMNNSNIIIKNDGPKPIYFMDGKETKEEALSKIDPMNIQSINVLKDKPAIDKYGSKGKNGVIEISIKKNIIVMDVIVQNTAENVIVHDVVVKNEPIFSQVEEPASVDAQEWRRFLEKNLSPILKELNTTSAKGKLVINLEFIVNTDGVLTDIKALNDPGYNLVPKLIDMMQYSPKWTPAKQNGRTVRSIHTQPITLVLTEKRIDPSITKNNSQISNTTHVDKKAIIQMSNFRGKAYKITMVNGLVQSIYVDGKPISKSDFPSYDKTIKEIQAMQTERMENSKRDISEGNNDEAVINYLEEKLQNLKKAQKKTNIN